MIPSVDSIVELLSCRGIVYLPRVTILVRVFRVTTNRDRLTCCDSRVDSVNLSKRVSSKLVIRQCSDRARLEGRVVAAGLRIKGVNTFEESVGIFARAATARVGQCVRSTPERLQEARHLRRLAVAVRVWCTHPAGKGATCCDMKLVQIRNQAASSEFTPRRLYGR